MSLWLALGAMTVVAAVVIGLPLLRKPSRAAQRRGFDLAVYRAQLDELAREEERGLILPREAAAARLEVERRMLAADAERAGPGGPALHRRPAVALALLAGFLVVSGGLYLRLGRPDLPAQPFAARTDQGPQVAGAGGQGAGLPSVEALIARLEARVASRPDDLDAWLRLARAYAMTRQFAPAADAYRRAIAVQDDVAALYSGLGEALAMASGGTVTEAAHEAFADTLERDPSDARARFYQGLWRVQRGELEPALEAWTALIADTPPGAPWLGDLRARTADLARELGKDPATVLPPVAAAPGTDDLAARAARLSARLDADPKDYRGWIALARTWDALGDSARAKEALEKGRSAFTGAPFVQQQLLAAATELGITLDGSENAPRGPTAEQMRAANEMTLEEQTAMIRDMVGGLAARLENDPDDLEGWRMLARSYGVLHQPQDSAEAYRHVAEALPDDLAAQTDYAEALLAAAPQDQPLGPAVTGQLTKVLDLDPDNPSALFYMGQAALEAGDPAGARSHWQRLLPQMAAGSPEGAQIQRMIDQLPPD